MTVTIETVPVAPVVIPNGWPPLTTDADYLSLAADIMAERGLNKTGACGSPTMGPVCLWLAVRVADGGANGEGEGAPRSVRTRYWRLNDSLSAAVTADARENVRPGHWPDWSSHPDTTTADAVALLRRAATLSRQPAAGGL